MQKTVDLLESCILARESLVLMMEKHGEFWNYSTASIAGLFTLGETGWSLMMVT